MHHGHKIALYHVRLDKQSYHGRCFEAHEDRAPPLAYSRVSDENGLCWKSNGKMLLSIGVTEELEFSQTPEVVETERITTKNKCSQTFQCHRQVDAV
jgi:hypothetical protein